MALIHVRKSLYHAYKALDIANEDLVEKSRLRVLCNNIGHSFGKDKSEEILDEIEQITLSFEDFFGIFQNKLLNNINELELDKRNEHIEQVDRICWLICAKKLCTAAFNDKSPVLSNEDIYKLWKIFNFFAETGEKDQLLLPLRVDIEEVRRIIQLLCQTLGLCELHRWKVNNNEEKLVDFPVFLRLIESAFSEPVNELSQGVSELSNDILLDILKKGFLLKYGNRVTTWKERWFVLYPRLLYYYLSPSTKDKSGNDENKGENKGCIEINSLTKVESIPDKPGNKPNRFMVRIPNRNYELCAPDLRSRNEWVEAIQKAIRYSGESQTFQYKSWLERKHERETRRKASAEDELRKQQERELIEQQQRELEEQKLRSQIDQELLERRRQELESEKLAREEIEAKLKEEEALRLSEQERLKELQEIKKELENLLEEERQAKRDEEIVRTLQARILDEELTKREELERIKEEQDRLLNEERNQRVDLEKQRQEQDELMKEAQQKLQELEVERNDADLKLAEAMEKMKLAEAERFKMEHRLKLKSVSTSLGLSRPKFVSDPQPYVTHRGKGAFSEMDFQKSCGSTSGDDQEAVFE